MKVFRMFLGKIIGTLHIVSILFLIFGCLLSKSFLIVHLILIPIVIIQWLLNKDQCVLTQLQWALEGRTAPSGEQGQFIKSLFNKIGWSFSDKQLFFIIYGIMIGSGLISFLRLGIVTVF